MKSFLLALFLLSGAANAAQPGAVPAVSTNAYGTSAGPTNISPSMLTGTGVNGIFSLHVGDSSNLVTTDFYPLYKNGVNYFVTTGHTAYCWAPLVQGVVGNGFQFVSSTAPIPYPSTSISNGVFQGGASGKYPNLITASSAYLAIGGNYQFGSATYAGIQVIGSVVLSIHMDCFEQ